MISQKYNAYDVLIKRNRAPTYIVQKLRMLILLFATDNNIKDFKTFRNN